MKKQAVQQFTTQELVKLCVEAANSYLRALDAAKPRVANRHHAEMFGAFRELIRRGEQDEIITLMGHEDPIVRQWSAIHALGFAPAQAVPVLEALQAGNGVPSLNAAVMLQLWRDGKLRWEQGTLQIENLSPLPESGPRGGRRR
jgi:Holliday junction resolvasome RuvABC DNA-binding subunit